MIGVDQEPAIGKDTQFQPGVSGNPDGLPKGTLHISTHIQNLLDNPEFEANILDPKIGIQNYKGAPVGAVLQVILTKAINGDLKASELLMKYGYSQKLEHSGEQKLIIEKRDYSA